MDSPVPPAPPVRTSPVSSGSAKLPPSRAQQAAKASWLAPIIVIIFNFVIKNASPPASQARSLVIAVVSLLFYLGGLVLAIYALSQVRSAGRRGVLAPALAGLILNGLFLLLVGFVAVSNFQGVRTKASQRQSLLHHGHAFTVRVPEMALPRTGGFSTPAVA
jgi:ABC-type glycerol-3-phosphate transport system permease component